jgi:hypothetical protein
MQIENVHQKWRIKLQLAPRKSHTMRSYPIVMRDEVDGGNNADWTGSIPRPVDTAVSSEQKHQHP